MFALEFMLGRGWGKVMTIRVREPLFLAIFGVSIAFGGVGSAGGNGPAHSSVVRASDQVVFIGDSITVGLGSRDPRERSRPALFKRGIGSDVEVVNLGVNGTTLDAIANGSPPMPQVRRNANNVVVIFAGSNDLQVGAGSVKIYTALRDFSFRLCRQGWSVSVGTVLARSFPAIKERERIALNNAMRSGDLARNGIVVLDYAALQDAGRIPLADGIHPNDAGYEKMASMERPFVMRSLRRR